MLFLFCSVITEGRSKKHAEAEVEPSSSLVEVEVEVEVGVEVEDGVEVGFFFPNVDVPSIQLRCSLDFFHYLHSWVAGWAGWWVVGKLENMLNSIKN